MAEPLFIHRAEARRQFREFAAGEITNRNLARGALLIALEDYPQLDVDHYLRELDALAERAAARSTPRDPAVFRLGHLHAVVFDDAGYRGNSENYYDPRNAYLNEVIDRKLGLPITLAIVFLHVAERLGLHAHGVGLPGHYIVKVQFELNELYVDPFHGGAAMTIGEIRALLARVAGPEVSLSRDHLRAWNGRETLARVLANLASMWTAAGEPRRAHSAQERIAMLAQ